MKQKGKLSLFLFFITLLALAAGWQTNLLMAQPVEQAGQMALPDPELDPLARIMSAPYAVETNGELAAVRAYHNLNAKELTLLDISDPTAPRAVGYLEASPNLIPGFETNLGHYTLSDNYAYLNWYTCDNPDETDCPSLVQIVDIVNPTTSRIAGVVPFTLQLSGLTVVDSMLYTLDVYGNFSITDVSQPYMPELKATLPLTSVWGNRKNIDIYQQNSRTYAYITRLTGDLEIVDVTDATAPFLMNTFSLTDDNKCIEDFDLVDNGTNVYAYIADCRVGLNVIDVTNPLTLTTVYTLFSDITNYLPAIEIIDNRAIFALDDSSGNQDPVQLYILDITTPTLPTAVMTSTDYYLGAQFDANVMVATDAHLLVVDNRSGMRVLDITDDPALIEVGRQAVVDAYSGLDLEGHYLYVAAKNGLQILDVLNPVAPQEVAYVNGIGNLSRVLVQDEYALYTDGNRLNLWDVTNVTTPTHISSVGLSSPDISGLVLYGNFEDDAYAFISNHYCLFCPTIEVVDLTNPLAPTVATVLDSVDIADMKLVDDYLYAVGLMGELYVWDVSSPMQPMLLSTTPIQSQFNATNITINGNYLYMSVGLSQDVTLEVWDIADPMQPVFVNALETSDVIKSLVYAEGYLYAVTRENDLLLVFDVSVPTQPTLIETQSLPQVNAFEGNFTEGLLIENGFVYSLKNGLSIWRHRNDVLGVVHDVWQRPFAGVDITADTLPIAGSGLSGGYATTEEVSGVRVVDATYNDYTIWPPERVVNFDEAPNREDFYVLGPAVQKDLTPTTTTTLIYTDTQQLTTTLTFPAGSVTQAIGIDLTPIMAFGGGNQAFAGNAFALTHDLGLRDYDNYVFGQIINISIHYGGYGITYLDETSLTLMMEKGGQWIEASELCPSVNQATIDTVNDIFRAQLCQTGNYALFGYTDRIYFPFVP